MNVYVCYFRVSIAQVNRQGLYLEAQQNAVDQFLEAVGSRVVGEFFEMEKGPSRDRPRLEEAIEQCRSTGAILLLAKVGTLVSNPDFLVRLAGSGVEIRSCDCASLVSENLEVLLEAARIRREQVGRHVRYGLQAAKVRGKELGSPGNLDPHSAEKGRVRGSQVRKSAADRFCRRFYPQIRQLRQEGLSMTAVARHLNQKRVPTATGRVGGWSCATVRNILLRGEVLGLEE